MLPSLSAFSQLSSNSEGIYSCNLHFIFVITAETRHICTHLWALGLLGLLFRSVRFRFWFNWGCYLLPSFPVPSRYESIFALSHYEYPPLVWSDLSMVFVQNHPVCMWLENSSHLLEGSVAVSCLATLTLLLQTPLLVSHKVGFQPGICCGSVLLSSCLIKETSKESSYPSLLQLCTLRWF